MITLAQSGSQLWPQTEDSAAAIPTTDADQVAWIRIEDSGDLADLSHVIPPSGDLTLLFFIFVIAAFLGLELISKVPSQLHTPLMSGSNAISGITIVGAMIAAGHTGSEFLAVALGTLAVIAATVNVVGGYLVTDRMLGMFKKKDAP